MFLQAAWAKNHSDPFDQHEMDRVCTVVHSPRYLPGSPKTEIPTTESSVLLGGVIQLSIDKDTKIPKLPETGRPQIIAHGPSLVHFLLSQTKSYRDTAMHTQFPITYALSSYKGGVDSL